jgi:raffinose/stachyose/melibiose transport system permease protein
MFTVDRAFVASLGNIAKLTAARLLIAVTFPLLAAELVFNLRNSRAAYTWRVLFVVPMVIPWMVLILVWQFIYEPQLGVLNSLLRAFGLGEWTQVWLGSSKLVRFGLNTPLATPSGVCPDRSI